MSQNKILLNTLFVIVLVGAVGYSALSKIPNLVTKERTGPAPRAATSANETQVQSPVYSKFDLQNWRVKQIFYREITGNPDDCCDSRFIIEDKYTGNQKILIQSTDALRDQIARDFKIADLLVSDGIINLAGSPNEGPEIYFFLSYDGGGPMFSLDVNTLKLKKLQNVFNYSPIFFISPSGDEAIEAESNGNFDTALALVCFNTDSKKTIITLKDGEAFNMQPPELDHWIDLRWLNENAIEYSVYRIVQDKYNSPPTNENFLRKVSTGVPSCR